MTQPNNQFNYMMLGRLQSDCEYFLNHGNRCEKHLWAGNVKEQIEEMKSIYNKLPIKPEWLTWEEILNYEELMNNNNNQPKEKSLTNKIDLTNMAIKFVKNDLWKI